MGMTTNTDPIQLKTAWRDLIYSGLCDQIKLLRREFRVLKASCYGFSQVSIRWPSGFLGSKTVCAIPLQSSSLSGLFVSTDAGGRISLSTTSINVALGSQIETSYFDKHFSYSIADPAVFTKIVVDCTARPILCWWLGSQAYSNMSWNHTFGDTDTFHLLTDFLIRLSKELCSALVFAGEHPFYTNWSLEAGVVKAVETVADWTRRDWHVRPSQAWLPLVDNNLYSGQYCIPDNSLNTSMLIVNLPFTTSIRKKIGRKSLVRHWRLLIIPVVTRVDGNYQERPIVRLVRSVGASYNNQRWASVGVYDPILPQAPRAIAQQLVYLANCLD